MQDYTKVKTVFKKKLKTISIKLDERFITNPAQASYFIRSAEDAHLVLREIFRHFDDRQEHFILLCLLANGQVQGYKHISSGGQGSAVVDTAIIFRSALLLGARSIIVAHNHPSEGTEPSNSDLEITRMLAQAGKVNGIPLLDHIIYTHHGYKSICEDWPSLFPRQIDAVKVGDSIWSSVA